MIKAICEILAKPSHNILIIFLLLAYTALAQKGSPLHQDLEIDNLYPHKKIIIFDPNERLHPIQNIKVIPPKVESSSQDILEISETFLKQNRRFLGFENLEENFRLERILKSPAGAHIHYQELIDGVPVNNSRIVVSVNRSNEVSFITRNYYQEQRIGEQIPQIKPEQAIWQARQYLQVSGELRGAPKAEQVIFKSNSRGLQLCYRVEIPASSPFGDWEVFIDAIHGEIVHVKNLIIYKKGTDGKGLVWDPDPLTRKQAYYGGDFSDNNDQDHDSLNAQRILVTLNELYTDDDGKYVLEGPFVKITDRDLPDDVFPHISTPDSFFYTRQQQGFEAVMVYYHIDKSYRRLLDLGFFEEDTIDGLQEFEADPHGNFGLDDSYYSPLLNYCAFGEGGVDDAEDAAVIWHEYGHAIQLNIASISYWTGGETRSLLEGCSDYWAASYKRRISSFGWNHVFLWDAGIQSANGDTTFWRGRRCDLDWVYSEQDSAAYAGTAAFGQIWSSALMRIWGDLGADITDKLFIASQYYWGPQPDFQEAAEAFIQADIDIYAGVHVLIILQWFEFHGLIDRSDYQPKISHDPMTDVNITDDGYEISCQILPSKAALDTTEIWLIWSLDSIFSDSSHLRFNISENLYSTTIPAVDEPSTINYYFFARDSLNIISVEPVDAPLEYFSLYVGPDSLPPPPVNIIVTDSISVVELTWQEILTGKYISYHIYKSENGISFNKIDSITSNTYTDTMVVIGMQYYYYLTTVFNRWESNPSDTVKVLVQAITDMEKTNMMPTVIKLEQNYPNPFNPTTAIGYQLSAVSDVEVSVYDILGRKVTTLVNTIQQAGYHQIEWDASGFSSGIYFYIFKAGDFTDLKKMVLVK